jgi:ankyrin repeat protein
MAADRPGFLENRKLANLTTAINRGETDKALALIDSSLPLDTVANGQHRSPMFAAIEAGNVAIVNALLDAGASLSASNDMKDTPLHAAVVTGSEAVIRTLIARGAAINAQVERKKHQYDGRTPLMNAAAGNNLTIVKLLLESGADPFLKDSAGFTALRFAEIFGKRTANYLRKIMGVSPAASELSLHDAAAAGIVERVARLLDEGFPVDTADEMGSTALHRAAMSDRTDAVRLLLERGASVDARNVRGTTPLLLAHKLDVVQLLLAAGANPNVEIGGGFTAFHHLVRTARADVLSAVIDAGANLESKTGDGQSVLDLAKMNRSAGRVLKARMGLASDALDRLRDELKDLPRLAQEPAFETAANWLGDLLHRKPAPWKRRKGVVYFHNVSVAKYLAPHFGEAEGTADAARMFSLCERLEDEGRAKGFTLVYVDSIPEEGRLPLILLPTSNKYAVLLACGTNGINKGHDTDAVISWLMAMETENSFVLTGCGFDFLDGRVAQPVKNAEHLAAQMIAFCPDMVDQAGFEISSLSRPDQIAAVAAALSSSGSFGFWWD